MATKLQAGQSEVAIQAGKEIFLSFKTSTSVVTPTQLPSQRLPPSLQGIRCLGSKVDLSPHLHLVPRMSAAMHLLITTRLQGRPKSRWNGNVKQDICKMKIKNWTVCVQDRGKWRDVVEKAKTFNI
jgi:hypothetical protein